MAVIPSHNAPVYSQDAVEFKHNKTTHYYYSYDWSKTSVREAASFCETRPASHLHKTSTQKSCEFTYAVIHGPLLQTAPPCAQQQQASQHGRLRAIF